MRAWDGTRRVRLPSPKEVLLDAQARAIKAAHSPLEFLLSSSLRRIARVRPDLFERLGAYRGAAFVLAPSDLPIAFVLHPLGARGWVRVVDHDVAPAGTARVSGTLSALLALFDGGADADSMLFARGVRVEGDTAALVALHNTLEEGSLSLADLIGMPAPLAAWSEALRRAFAAHSPVRRAVT